MRENPLNIVIVGGSLAGLMHGVMIKRLGHNAHVLEQYTSSTREGQAAGISAGPQMRELLQKLDLCDGKYALVNPGVQYIDTNLKVIRFQEVPMMLTSWNILYYRLRANFDGLKSEYCTKLREEPEGQGKAVYDTGKRVTDVTYANGQVTVVFDDLINGKSGRLQPDLVIGADGSNSSIRQSMLPQLEKPYAGYFTWRGTIPERDVSDETKRIFDGKVTVSIMDRSYIVLYTIPGEGGSFEPGKRLLNFVWYCNCPEDSQLFEDAMTDVDGHLHRSTVPPGKMRADVWARQCAYGNETLAPPFKELVNKITQPFITAVSDYAAPRASYFDGKLILVGDALALFRPHVGSSTNQCAMDCLLLEQVLEGRISLSEWERRVTLHANVTRLWSIAWGTYYMSRYPTYLLNEMRYRLGLAARWWARL